ncbi:MAG: hypothetical protein M3384_12375 [Acidobacteriota bacterium]|nr:hypothetical protein [Acidobacteriota bacterium]
MRTVSKLLVIIGTFLVFVADSYALWSFFTGFAAIKTGEASGIGAFGAAIDSAYHGVLFSFVGIFFLFIGCLLLLIPSRPKPTVS